MDIGLRIVEIRKQKKISQGELAKRSGLSQAGISYIEKGLRSPSADTIELLAAALGTTVSALMGEQEPAPRDEFAETLYRRPGMRILFDAAKDAPDEVLQKTADLLEAMKNEKKS